MNASKSVRLSIIVSVVLVLLTILTQIYSVYSVSENVRLSTIEINKCVFTTQLDDASKSEIARRLVGVYEGTFNGIIVFLPIYIIAQALAIGILIVKLTSNSEESPVIE
jgi:hypothetical protein